MRKRVSRLLILTLGLFLTGTGRSNPNPPLSDHFYVVLKDEDYQKLGQSDFLKELGFFEFNKTVKIGDRHWTGSYLSGESFYIEFFSDKSEIRNVKPYELLSNSGLAFVANFGSLIEKLGKDTFPFSDAKRVQKSLSKENGNYLGFAVSPDLHFWIYEPPQNSDGSPYDRKKPIQKLRTKKKDPKVGNYPLKDLDLIQIALDPKTQGECNASFRGMFFKSKKDASSTHYFGSGQNIQIIDKKGPKGGIMSAHFSLNGGQFNWPVGLERKIGNLSFKRISETQLVIVF